MKVVWIKDQPKFYTGWLVCSLDTGSPVPTDVLDNAIWEEGHVGRPERVL